MMLNLSFFLKGLVIGILTSAPVGPMALLCIQRTVTASRLLGLATGFGAAAADTCYATMAAFALSYISGFILQHLAWFRLVGSGFLFFFGVWFFMKIPAPRPKIRDASTYFTAFGSAFGFTLTNPITVFAFAALFTAFGIEGPDIGVPVVNGYTMSYWFLVLGVFIGANLWWLALTMLSGHFRDWFRHPNFTVFYRVLGVVFLFSGIIVLATLLRWH